jgi:uncharacterized protein YndB with AHSA1/START domain
MSGKPLQVATPTEREIVMTRLFDAARKLVFDAHTKPELVKRWLLGPPGWTMPFCEIDLRVGGKYRYEWRHPEKPGIGTGGVYREIAAPERIVHSELMDGSWPGGEAIITLFLTERGGKTTLIQTMLFSSREARDMVLKTGMTKGVEASYANLDEILASAA